MIINLITNYCVLKWYLETSVDKDMQKEIVCESLQIRITPDNELKKHKKLESTACSKINSKVYYFL